MFAKEEEIIELAKIVAENDGIVVAHIRNESEQILKAADEYLRIAEKAKCKAHFSHFKVCGNNKDEKSKRLVEKLVIAEKKGIPISFDMYPYDAGSTTLQAILPPWAQEGTPRDIIERLSSPDKVIKMAQTIFDFTNTEWENFIQISEGGLDGIMISDAPDSHKFIVGKSLEEIGKDAGINVTTQQGKIQTFELIAKYLVETNLSLAMISHNQSMTIVNRFLHLKEWMTLGTDGVIGRKPHPRLYGTMTRFLRMVREAKSYTLQEAISRITSKPSQLIQLSDRGTIQTGSKADLVIFNCKVIREDNSYMKPLYPSQGIYEVIINGERSYVSN